MLASHLQLKEFYASHSQYPKVVAHMRKNWAALAGHWAWFGRVSILELEANTTVSIHTSMPDGTVACTARGVCSCLEKAGACRVACV